MNWRRLEESVHERCSSKHPNTMREIQSQIKSKRENIVWYTDDIASKLNPGENPEGEKNNESVYLLFSGWRPGLALRRVAAGETRLHVVFIFRVRCVVHKMSSAGNMQIAGIGRIEDEVAGRYHQLVHVAIRVRHESILLEWRDSLFIQRNVDHLIFKFTR